MRPLRLTALALAGVLLAACGSNDGGDAAPAAGAPAGRDNAPQAAKTGNATAEEVAKEMRGKVKCPPKIQTKRADGEPVDDVVGVRPGMSYEEAANVVLCSHEMLVVTPANRGFNIKTFGVELRQGFQARFAEPRIQKTGQEIMREMQQAAMDRGNNVVRRDLQPGQSKWFVATMGMPGQEKVIGVAREELFEEERRPTVDSIRAALIKKYGTPTREFVPQRGWVKVIWGYDTFGRLVTETSPQYLQCSSGISSPDQGMNLTPDCGVVVSAEIIRAKDNDQLASSLRVGSQHSANGYELLVATEQTLQAGEAERRAREVQEASKNADVTL